MHEFELIKNYFSKLSKNNTYALNLNDDVFFHKSKNLAISVDTYIQGIHFFDFKKPELVIKKVIRSSISDLICKGVKPKYYFIAASGDSRSFSPSNLKKISKSLREEQKKYDIFLSGGDTVFSNRLSFSITSIGFSKKIISRNSAKLNDDIYITGNLGDSYVGLNILKKKINVSKKIKEYFEKKYYLPSLHLNLRNKLLSIANTSIDVSDGLVTDLEKLINKQKLSYKLNLNRIPISNNLKKLIISKKFDIKSFISKGDDYEILFTANRSKSRIIDNISKSLGIKISKIGKICSSSEKSQIIDQKGDKIALKNNGYYHNF